MKRANSKEEKLKRTHKLSLMLNDREMRALNVYCTRFRISNKSEFLRATIMTEILKRFDDEHPTLWEEPVPTLFNQNTSK